MPTHKISILVLEDHDALRRVTVKGLEANGHQVFSAAYPEEMDEIMAQSRIDVLLLDLNLPGEDGLSICRRLRQSSPHLGIVMLTARITSQDRIQGYLDGADVYLTKPASLEEVEAAVQSVARRQSVSDIQAPWVLNQGAMTLCSPTIEEKLTDAEVNVIRALALSPHRMLETWQLLEILGLTQVQDPKAALEMRIARLRKRFSSLGTDRAIVAIRMTGYQLAIPILVK